MSDALIAAQGLTKYFGANLAVAGVDINLRQGEILGLLGPNGAGKTTTLRMLAGCLAPTSGSVAVKGADMASAPAKAKAALGYLPERPPLYPEQTVNEYLGFCARLHRVPRRQRKQALASAMHDCGLADMGRRQIGNLSKGYQQRVGIAQAILHRPDVVILDEPTVGLDPNQIREIRALIRRLGEAHSVILSSHILPEIQATCARVAIIYAGKLVYDQDMRAIESAPEALRVGLKRAPGAETLATLDGVREAVDEGGGYWRLECDIEDCETDLRERVAAEAAAKGWGLFELTPSRKTLEDIFIELTAPQAVDQATGDEESPGHAGALGSAA